MSSTGLLLYTGLKDCFNDFVNKSTEYVPKQGKEKVSHFSDVNDFSCDLFQSLEKT